MTKNMATDSELRIGRRNGRTVARRSPRRWPLRAGTLVAAAFALAACAGIGAGMKVSSTPSAPLQPAAEPACLSPYVGFEGLIYCSLPPELREPRPAPTPTHIEQQYADTVLGRINALAAHDAGYTGADVKVAVIDRKPRHGDVFVEQSYSVGDSPVYFGDHADAVAGIIAAKKNDQYIYGVAYDARLISIDASSEAGPASVEPYVFYPGRCWTRCFGSLRRSVRGL